MWLYRSWYSRFLPPFTPHLSREQWPLLTWLAIRKLYMAGDGSSKSFPLPLYAVFRKVPFTPCKSGSDNEHFISYLSLYLFFFYFLKKIGGHKSFLWGRWCPCFGLLVRSSLDFKAREDTLLTCFIAYMRYLLTSWQCRWTNWEPFRKTISVLFIGPLIPLF